MIQVTNELKVYETNGADVSASKVTVRVESHSIHRDMVIIVVDGERLTVCARDLTAAINNATNTGRV